MLVNVLSQKKSMLKIMTMSAVLAVSVMPTFVHAAPTVIAKLQALENNKAYQVSKMLENRGYKTESVTPIVYNGIAAFDVYAKRGGERVNFKISEETLQIISTDRY